MFLVQILITFHHCYIYEYASSFWNINIILILQNLKGLFWHTYRRENMYTFEPEWLNWGAKGMEYSRESNLSSDAFQNHKYAQPKVIRKRKSLKKAKKLETMNFLTWMYAWKRLSLGHQVCSSLFISLGAQQGCQFWQICHIWHLTKDNLCKYQIWQDTNKENMLGNFF